jgi:hypothetical protein
MKAKEFRLTFLDETSVAGRKAAGILVMHDGHPTFKLYFDKETHLLVKGQAKETFYGGKVRDVECLFSDYRDVQGIKQPFAIETFLDGTKDSDEQFIEMKLFDKPLDEKLFSKP